MKGSRIIRFAGTESSLLCKSDRPGALVSCAQNGAGESRWSVVKKQVHRLFASAALSAACGGKEAEMKYTYSFATGTEAVEIGSEWASLLEEMDRAEEANRKRETRRHLSLDAMLFDGQDLAAPGDAETPLLEKEREASVRAAFACLTETQKRRLLMHLDGMPYREIGRVEGANWKSCEESVRSAKNKLKNFF